jgi:hypothetical protein
MSKIEKALVGTYCKMYNGLNKVVKDEKGDTNFISIIIILGIVIVVAGVFMGFKDQIVAMVRDKVNAFTIQ